MRIIILRKSDTVKPVKPRERDFYFDDGSWEKFDSVGYTYAWETYQEWNRVNGSTFNPWMVLINTVILQEEGTQDSVEGCLSVPGSTYRVTRPTHVAFKYTKENGKRSGVHLARGENAIKLKHEHDHELGLLLPDIASEAYPGEHPNEPL